MINNQFSEPGKIPGVQVNRGKTCLLITILAAMFLTGGCTLLDTTPPSSGKLVIVNHSLTITDSGNATVLITVKNTSSSILELAEVRVNFLDNQGGLIDSSKDAVMNLKPGEIWDFTIQCQGMDCAKIKDYEIETLSGSTSGIR